MVLGKSLLRSFNSMFYKMHERDLVLERLEKELAEKRKELEEIRKLLERRT